MCSSSLLQQCLKTMEQSIKQVQVLYSVFKKLHVFLVCKTIGSRNAWGVECAAEVCSATDPSSRMLSCDSWDPEMSELRQQAQQKASYSQLPIFRAFDLAWAAWWPNWTSLNNQYPPITRQFMSCFQRLFFPFFQKIPNSPYWENLIPLETDAHTAYRSPKMPKQSFGHSTTSRDVVISV